MKKISMYQILVYVLLLLFLTGCSMGAPVQDTDNKALSADHTTNQTDSRGTPLNEQGEKIILSPDSSIETPSSLGRQIHELFLGENCLGQCWAGIQPDITSQNQAIDILKSKYGLENVQVQTDHATWVANDLDVSEQGEVRFFDNHVRLIRVLFTGKNITVKDIIAGLGNPGSVGVGIAFSEESLCANSALLYPDKGIEIAIIPNNAFVGVRESQTIYSAEIGLSRSVENWGKTDTVYLEWAGFDDYCAKAYSTLEQ